jgi:dCTP deaminase
VTDDPTGILGSAPQASPEQPTGVLPAQWLRKAREQGIITAPAFDDAQIQPASVDLRLGDWAYRLRCSFLPGNFPVTERLPDFEMDRLDLREGAVLERNRPYLIPLCESLALPTDLMARANPKSSTGRLDIFCRVITDRGHLFDDVAAGYHGPLFLEVVSRSFTVRVRRGVSLNQLRLVRRPPVAPSPSVSVSVSDAELRAFHEANPLLSVAGYPDYVPTAAELPVDDGLFLSLALPEGDSPVGWRARKNSRLLDLTAVGVHDPDDFWEPVFPERGGGVVLEPEEFYLLLSRERVRVPPELAAEMNAYDPTNGELRAHYAGFFDPGFGHGPSVPSGSQAALEVRAHDVPFMVADGQRVCRLTFERMAETPDVLYGATDSHYQFQTGALSKHFHA